MKVRNRAGKVMDCSEIPDLWHLAEWLRKQGMYGQSDMVLEVWHQAHYMQQALLDEGEAGRVEPELEQPSDHDDARAHFEHVHQTHFDNDEQDLY